MYLLILKKLKKVILPVIIILSCLCILLAALMFSRSASGNKSFVQSETMAEVPIFETAGLKVMGHDIRFMVEAKELDLFFTRIPTGEVNLVYEYDYVVRIGTDLPVKPELVNGKVQLKEKDIKGDILDVAISNLKLIGCYSSNWHTRNSVYLDNLFNDINNIEKTVRAKISERHKAEARTSIREQLTSNYKALGYDVIWI